jgi:ribose transport system substrate-binding protein
MAFGAKRAAADAGVDLTLVGGKGYTDPSDQLTDAENALSRGADALVLAPVDYQGSVPIVDRAVGRGVPVINVSTEVNSDKAYKVLQDDYVQGETSARALIAAAPQGGAGIIMGGPANATWARRRVLGFKHELAKHPNFKVAVTTNSQVEPGAGLATFENAVQAHPNPRWVYSVYVYLLLPDAIPARYRNVPYVTAGFEPLVAAGLRSGRIDASVTNVPVEMGRMGVGAGVAALAKSGPKHGLACLPNTPITRADIASPVAQAELMKPNPQVGG